MFPHIPRNQTARPPAGPSSAQADRKSPEARGGFPWGFELEAPGDRKPVLVLAAAGLADAEHRQPRAGIAQARLGRAGARRGALGSSRAGVRSSNGSRGAPQPRGLLGFGGVGEEVQ